MRRKGEAMLTYDTAQPGATLRARRLRRDSTEAEKLLWRSLREKLPAYKWRRQMPIGPYIADFACFGERLVIEIDGGQHSVATDAARTAFIQAQGYRIVRFWNDDVMSNIEGVLTVIDNELSSPSRALAGAHPFPSGRGREAQGAGRVGP